MLGNGFETPVAGWGKPFVLGPLNRDPVCVGFKGRGADGAGFIRVLPPYAEAALLGAGVAPPLVAGPGLAGAGFPAVDAGAAGDGFAGVDAGAAGDGFAGVDPDRGLVGETDAELQGGGAVCASAAPATNACSLNT